VTVEHRNEVRPGKLRALVGGEDFRRTVPYDRFLERIDTKKPL
jgi:hypothetical protein